MKCQKQINNSSHYCGLQPFTKADRARLVKDAEFPYRVEAVVCANEFWQFHSLIQTLTDERVFIRHAGRAEYRIAEA